MAERCICCEMKFRTPEGLEMPPDMAWIQGYVMALTGAHAVGLARIAAVTGAALCDAHRRVWDVGVELSEAMGLAMPELPS